MSCQTELFGVGLGSNHEPWSFFTVIDSYLLMPSSQQRRTTLTYFTLIPNSFKSDQRKRHAAAVPFLHCQRNHPSAECLIPHVRRTDDAKPSAACVAVWRRAEKHVSGGGGVSWPYLYTAYPLRRCQLHFIVFHWKWPLSDVLSGTRHRCCLLSSPFFTELLSVSRDALATRRLRGSGGLFLYAVWTLDDRPTWSYLTADYKSFTELLMWHLGILNDFRGWNSRLKYFVFP